MENMETSESSLTQSEDLDHHHWVEKLFPPHFTFQDLLESNSTRRAEEPELSSVKMIPSDQSEKRRQIYTDVLIEVLDEEERIRRINLAKRISRDQSTCHAENQKSCEILIPDEKIKRGECIWNESDISKLRAALTELQKDRWRLRELLKNTEEQFKNEREERRRLQEILKESKEHLGSSRKEAARHGLVVQALRMEVHQKDFKLQNLAKQCQKKAEEADKLRAELRRTRNGYHQIKQEHSDLAWELERVKEKLKIEGVRQMEEARLENQAAVLRLQKEVEEAHAELRAEKERHGCSLSALDVLRQHFNNQ